MDGARGRGLASGWTFGLEAFAVDARPDTLRQALEKTVAALDSTPGMPPLDAAWVEQSSPGWTTTSR